MEYQLKAKDIYGQAKAYAFGTPKWPLVVVIIFIVFYVFPGIFRYSYYHSGNTKIDRLIGHRMEWRAYGEQRDISDSSYYFSVRDHWHYRQPCKNCRRIYGTANATHDSSSSNSSSSDPFSLGDLGF